MNNNDPNYVDWAQLAALHRVNTNIEAMLTPEQRRRRDIVVTDERGSGWCLPTLIFGVLAVVSLYGAWESGTVLRGAPLLGMFWGATVYSGLRAAVWFNQSRALKQNTPDSDLQVLDLLVLASWLAWLFTVACFVAIGR